MGGAAVVGILLLFWGIHYYKVYKIKHQRVPAPTLATVVVKNAAPGEYHIFDTLKNDGDVTDQASTGLPAGNYKLVASKLGFEGVQKPFTIDPSKETTTQLEIAWQRLPVALTIKMTKAEGALKVDNAEQILDSGLEYKASWQSGSHTISWQGPLGDSLQVQFDVNDDGVEMKSSTFQGRFVGIIAALSKGKVTCQAIHTGGLLKIVDGQSERLGAADTFSIEDGKVVSFKAHPGGFPLGDLPSGQPGQPLIYVYLVPPQPPKGPPPLLPAKLATVDVKYAAPGEYQILDSNGTDVTNRALPAGNYKLVASKAGFQKVERSFTIDPSKEPTTTLEIKWQNVGDPDLEKYCAWFVKWHPGQKCDKKP